MTPCECSAAGFCERHQISKSEHWVMLCQTREDYFQIWETGTRGPGQPIDPSRTIIHAASCQYRSQSVGNLSRGCCGCVVFRCSKYSTYCTLVTPAEYGLPIIGTEDRLTRENGRACSICRAAGEDE